MPKQTDAQRRAKAKYQREKVRNKSVQFFPSEYELVDYAEKQGTFSGYVKSLIRNDMNKE